MRLDYSLSDETRKVLSGNVQRIAEEMEVLDKYLYAILADDKTDPFAPFVRMYAASVRAGGPVCEWDNKLASIRTRYEKEKPCRSALLCLSDKIATDSATTIKMLDAVKDNIINAREAAELQKMVDEERKALDAIEVHLQWAIAPEGGKRRTK